MLGTLDEEVDGGDKRMSMWTDEEKRQSLMKTTQDSRVKNKKKVDPDDLNNVDVLLAAEKKLAKKLSLTVEQPVVMKETDEMFGPWTAATDEIDLDCGEMFDIKINPQTDVEVMLDDLQPQLKKELQEALKKNLEALLTSVKEKAGDGIDITMLDDELQAVIVDDMLLVITKVLKKEFKEKKIGEIEYTPTVKEAAKDKLLGPLNKAVAETIDLAQQQTAEVYAADRAAIQKQIQKLEVIRNKLTEHFERNIEDTASQCAKNDLRDRVSRTKIKEANLKIEHELKVIDSNQRKRARLELADAQYDSSGSSENEEDTDSESEDDVSSAVVAEKRAADKEKRLERRKEVAASVAGSKYGKLSEADIREKIENTKLREKGAVAKVRQIVMDCMKSQKGGVASRETAATKEDLKDLNKLQLGSKVKDSRSESKGRLLMVVILQVILKKPDAYPALGPMLACYADINVSLSNFLIATTDRLCQYVDAPEYQNPWGLGQHQMTKFAEETKTLYELMIAACPQAMANTMMPDSDYDMTIRNRKIELCGIKNDATTFVEAWFTQNNYINPRKMEQMRTDVLDVKKLWHNVKLIKACKTAMTIVRNANLQGLKISWFQTGELWVETITACHPDIKVEMVTEKMKDCPAGVDDNDCVHCLEKLLEGISSIALKVQGLQSGQPTKPHANSELYLTVEDSEVAVILQKADRITEDLCMTVDGHNDKSGAVKAPATRNRNYDKRNPKVPPGAVVCAVIQGNPGGHCKKVLEGEGLRYHNERMAKIDKMSGTNKPPKFPCCGRHFFMILKDDDKLCFGKPLRWNFAGNKGKLPWGRPVTKKDLLITGGGPQQAAVATVAAVNPAAPTTMVMPVGAAASAQQAWTAPAQTLAVVNRTTGNSAAQQAGAPAPAPAPAPTAASTGGGSNAEMMAILMGLKEQSDQMVEQIASNDARQEFERIKMQKEMQEMKVMSSTDGQFASAADADRARRLEKLQLLDAKGKKPAFTFSK